MKSIPLTNGMFAMVDDADYQELVQYEWQAHQSTKDKWYARRSEYLGEYKQTHHYMHRQIMGFPDVGVDHRDGDGLNNQKSSNLRLATQSDNMCNTRIRKDNTTGFKGVHLRSDTLKYAVYVWKDGKRKCAGCYPTIEEAVAVRAQVAAELHGDFVRGA